ncbi:MAG: energy-coupling factor transporter ATPase [Bacilli bacterium]|jgi:energy-coupling factor transport system ATP-binding protein|nr:energy-coupling factor transporter ATPase [Bacilli bacterium]
MSFIDIQNLTFQYSKKDKAVNNVSMQINRGDFVCLLGHNGSGKSTLAKLIVGLLKPDTGSIKIDGIELTEETVDELRQKIGIVFQNPDNQFVGVSVKDDIAFGLENRQLSRQDMLDKIDLYAKLVSMDRFLDANPESLSGGEKQRVAIAGVLACDPEVIIFDEATSMLDPRGVQEVVEVIRQLKGKRTVISITHNLKEALLANKVIVMNEGSIVLAGTPQEIFQEKEILKASKLDILETMKLIEMVEQSTLLEKAKIEETLWELTYQK